MPASFSFLRLRNYAAYCVIESEDLKCVSEMRAETRSRTRKSYPQTQKTSRILLIEGAGGCLRYDAF